MFLKFYKTKIKTDERKYKREPAVLSDKGNYSHRIKIKVIPLQSRCGPEGG
jgi:hypothetical protein